MKKKFYDRIRGFEGLSDNKETLRQAQGDGREGSEGPRAKVQSSKFKVGSAEVRSAEVRSAEVKSTEVKKGRRAED